MELSFNERKVPAFRHKRRSSKGKRRQQREEGFRGGNELRAFESRSLVWLEPCGGGSSGPVSRASWDRV